MSVREFINSLFVRLYLKAEKDYKFHKEKAFSDRTVFQEWQLKSLNKVLSHAREQVPYYKKMFFGLELPLSDLTKMEALPILEKATIRKEQEQLYASSHSIRASYLNTSGGSTGRPLPILQDVQYARSGAGLFALIKETRTGSPYCSTVSLWGATRDLYGDKNTLKGRLTDLLNNSKQFNSARLTPKDISRFINFINERPPELLVAYAQSAFEIAKYADKNNIIIRPQNAIHTGAGKLYPFMREQIEKVFGAPVFDHYGSREVGAIATECNAHNGLHLLESAVYVEVVDEHGRACLPGLEGDVLVTTLHNFSMPLIRYRIGDRAVRQVDTACSCGITYPKLEKISGRTSDNFIRKEGGFVSGEYLTLTFNHVQGVESFQIRQKRISELEISLVIDESYNLSVEEVVTGKLKNLFDESLKVSYFYVDKIPKTSSGKHLFTISELN